MVLPAGARSVSVDASGDLDKAQITGWLRTGDGRDVALLLQPEGDRLVAAVPAGLPAPTRLFALALVEPPDYATHHLHKIGEGGTDVAVLTGSVTLGVPQFAGGTPDGPPGGTATWAGWGSTGAQVDAAAQRLTVGFQFTGQRVVVSADAGDRAPVPVLADPVTAAGASNGLLQLVVGGDRPVAARGVRVGPRFPAAGDRFGVAGPPALADALDAGEP